MGRYLNFSAVILEDLVLEFEEKSLEDMNNESKNNPQKVKGHFTSLLTLAILKPVAYLEGWVVFLLEPAIPLFSGR